MQERKAKCFCLIFDVNDRISLETIAFNYFAEKLITDNRLGDLNDLNSALLLFLLPNLPLHLAFCYTSLLPPQTGP